MIEPLQHVLDIKVDSVRKFTLAYYYPEFQDVIIQHFVLCARAIQTQVDGWVAEDPSLSSSAQRLYDLLAQLQHSQQHPQPQGSGGDGDNTNEIEVDDDRKPAAEVVIQWIEEIE